MQLADLLTPSGSRYVYPLSKTIGGAYLPDSDLRGIPVFRRNPYRPEQDKRRPGIGTDRVDFVALYFSGSQSPSCQVFTARLMEIYHAVRFRRKSFEVVQVCGDGSRRACMSSLGAVPWLAVPFEEQQVVAMLFRKFRVTSMPTMVMLDQNGKVINRDTVSAILSDKSVAAAGEAFPWPAPILANVLASGQYSRCNDYGFSAQWEDLASVEAIGFLCVASWNQASMALKERLMECYEKINRVEFSATKKRFEVVLVSADHDETGFRVTREGVPWLAIPFSDQPRIKSLRKLLDLQEVPCLHLVSPTEIDRVLTKDGEGAVFGDPDGLGFPWKSRSATSSMTLVVFIGDRARASCFFWKALTRSRETISTGSSPCTPCE